jgi:DNA invertase Pin-like site-specific DNA recombinase
MTTVGYARCSTRDQTLEVQRSRLRAAGCTKVYEDEAVSGARTERPGLTKAFRALKEGDVLVVVKLDRLGRNLPHLLELVAELKERKVGFKSLDDPVDTTTPVGMLTFQIFGALAEYERSVIFERCHHGRVAAKAAGVTFGRKSTMSQADADVINDLNLTVAEAAAKVGISKRHVYRLRARLSPALPTPKE